MNLFEQFKRAANFYFLILLILQVKLFEALTLLSVTGAEGRQQVDSPRVVIVVVIVVCVCLFFFNLVNCFSIRVLLFINLLSPFL